MVDMLHQAVLGFFCKYINYHVVRRKIKYS